eukprot:11463180-Karenia_brevis.AAC.1
MAKNHSKLCHKIARLCDNEDLGRYLAKSAWIPSAKVTSMLDVTLKTHKEQGHIVPRSLHCGASYAFTGVSSWVRHELKRDFLLNSHVLLRDTRQLISKLRNIVVSDMHFFVKAD